MTIMIRRAYDGADPADGLRVLIDRLWPRGVRKSELNIGLWARELTPSAELRVWFHRDRSRFDLFRTKYLEELRANSAHAQALLNQAGRRRLTLVTAAREVEQSHAVVFRDFLGQLSARGASRRRRFST